MLRQILVVLAASASLALGAPPAGDKAKPKAPPAPSVPLKVTVVSVSGPAEKLLATNGKNKWEPLKAGDELSELTVIRTGLGAKVELKFEDRGTVVVNNATKIGLAELRKTGGVAKARLGLKYGTIRASVEGRRSKNDFRIATPVATLSVRGSIADVGFHVDSPKVVNAHSGHWRMVRALALAIRGDEDAAIELQQIVTGGESAETTLQPYILIALQQHSLPIADLFGLTPEEQQTLINNPTGVRATNTPSGGSGSDDGGTGDSTVPTPIVPNDEPGYP